MVKVINVNMVPVFPLYVTKITIVKMEKYVRIFLVLMIHVLG